MSLLFTGLFGQTALALIISSVFYNLQNDTASLFSRGALLFFAILMAAFQSSLEVCHIQYRIVWFVFSQVTQILTLYAQRPIVEKHAKYAFYHPFTEAIASMITDLPNKIGTAIVFDLSLYFMTNLRRTPGHFFVFFLFSFMCTLAMSMFFRSIASLSRTLSQVNTRRKPFTWLWLTISPGYGSSSSGHPCFDHLHWFCYSDNQYAPLV